MAPRQGHFDAMLRVFGYVKQNPDGSIIIDPNIPAQPHNLPEQHNWTEWYPDAHEAIPPDMPLPKGPAATTMCYVDADHAHDVITRRSVTGILLLTNNNMPIKWYSKRQTTRKQQ